MLPAHHKRIVTGFVLFAFLALFLSLGGWPLRIAVAVVSGFALREFLAMYWPSGVYVERKAAAIILGVLLVCSQALDPLWTLAVLGMAFVVVAVLFLVNYGSGNQEARLGHYSPVLHGLLYIPLMLQLALYLTPTEQWLVILAAVASDTGGYYAGSMFGKRKLWPVVSPKKTWEGLFGGMALCVGVCLALAAIARAADLRMLDLPLWAWIFVGLALHMAALFGDLFESALKRTLGVKDSGELLPGHGGILDRIDSILFTVAVFLFLRQILRFL